MNKKVFPALIILLIFFVSCNKKEIIYPEIENGQIDLENWDFNNNGPVELKGDWKHVWLNDNPDYMDMDYDDSSWENYKTPDNWRNNKDSPFGYIWLRLHIKLNTDEKLFLYQSTCSNSYSMYINGDEYIQIGNPGNNRENTESKILPVIKALPLESTLLIAWKISNFDDLNGGPGIVPVIGTYTDLFYKLWLPDIFNAFILGILIIICLTHVIFWFGRKKNYSFLYFALFCLIIIIRMISDFNYIQRLFPEFNFFHLQMKLEYLTLSLGAMVFPRFMHLLFKEETKKIFPALFYISGGLCAIFIIFTPTYIYTGFQFVYQLLLISVCIWVLIISLKASFNKREGSIILFFGTVGLFLTIINDILTVNGIINSISLTPIGAILFIFAQSSMLSLTFSRALETSEYLTENLKKEVEEKTKVLNKQTKKLYEQEKYSSLGKLVEGISHDVLNPLTGVKGPLLFLEKAINKYDETKSDSEIKEAFKHIFNNINRITEIAKSLRAISFKNLTIENSINLKEAIESIIPLFADRIKKRININIEIKNNFTVKANRNALTHIFLNLISNAIDAIEEQGEITIHSISDNGKIIKVTDSGRGIKKQDLPFIFDLYYTTNENEERGFGLYFVKDLIIKLGWEIDVESTRGKGTTFVLKEGSPAVGTG